MRAVYYRWPDNVSFRKILDCGMIRLWAIWNAQGTAAGIVSGLYQNITRKTFSE